jgi:hemerythrin-like metal-binding protein
MVELIVTEIHPELQQVFYFGIIPKLLRFSSDGVYTATRSKEGIMALLTWKKKYSLGVKALDNQRKTFIEILNEFHAAMLKGQGENMAGQVLLRLKDYAREHFPAEERLLESIKFPGLAQHREYHRGLIEKLEEFIARHESGDHGMYISLLHFIREWQIRHLLQHDREYIPCLAEREIE